MKKVILSESQIRRLVDVLVTEQSSNGEKGYRLCGLSLIEKGGVFYLKNPETNEIEFLD